MRLAGASRQGSARVCRATAAGMPHMRLPGARKHGRDSDGIARMPHTARRIQRSHRDPTPSPGPAPQRGRAAPAPNSSADSTTSAQARRSGGAPAAPAACAASGSQRRAATSAPSACAAATTCAATSASSSPAPHPAAGCAGSLACSQGAACVAGPHVRGRLRASCPGSPAPGPAAGCAGSLACSKSAACVAVTLYPDPPPRLLSWAARAGSRSRGCACAQPCAASAAPSSPGPGPTAGCACIKSTACVAGHRVCGRLGTLLFILDGKMRQVSTVRIGASRQRQRGAQPPGTASRRAAPTARHAAAHGPQPRRRRPGASAQREALAYPNLP